MKRENGSMPSICNYDALLRAMKAFCKHEQMVLKAVLIMFKLIFNNRMKSIKKASWEVGHGSQNHTRATPATAEWLSSRMPV